jgi:hypothetical protein
MLLNFEYDLIPTDRKRYPLEHSVARHLTEIIPYGINLVGALKVGDQYVSNRKVCVIDSGYDITHEDLPKATATGISMVDGIHWYTAEDSGHGTHVAGTIAAVGNNDNGVIGINRNNHINLHFVRVFGGDKQGVTRSDLVKAVEQCRDAGSNIVSMSLGGAGYSSFEFEAYKIIYEKFGVMLVAAAGNSGDNSFTYPASYESVISVAAIDSNKNVAGFSQQNSQVDLAAPGVGVLSTYPGNRYVSMSGTSMSTPHVSGVAALIWSHFPDETAQTIRDVLQKTAEDLGSSGRDNVYGHGLVRADRAYAKLSRTSTSKPTTECPYPVTKIIIKTDNHPYETMWTLKDTRNGDTIKSVGTYGLLNYRYVSTLCLAPGQYQINIYDSAGDGLCCANGQGFYRVKYDGRVLVRGSIFQTAISKRFTTSIAPSSSPSAIPSTDPSLQPSFNPSESQIPSSVPSEAPSIFPSVSIMPSVSPSDQPSQLPSTSPQPTRTCPYSKQMHVELLFKTDANSNENMILLKNLNKNKIVWNITDIPQSTTVSYGKCVLKRRCYRIILKDSGSNGLNDGYFSVSVDGVLIKSTRFQTGKRWRSPLFGRC